MKRDPEAPITYSNITDEKSIPQLIALINGAYRGTGGKGRWTTEAHLIAGERIKAEHIRKMLDDPAVSIFGAFSKGRLVGCISTSVQDDLVEFGTFAVEESQQGQGLGKRLLAYAERNASQLGKSLFQVTVVSRNERLLAFYQRRGYRLTGERVEYPSELGVGQPKEAGISLLVLRKETS